MLTREDDLLPCDYTKGKNFNLHRWLRQGMDKLDHEIAKKWDESLSKCFQNIPCCVIKAGSYAVFLGSSLAVPRVGLRAFSAEGPGSIPGQGTKIL